MAESQAESHVTCSSKMKKPLAVMKRPKLAALTLVVAVVIGALGITSFPGQPPVPDPIVKGKAVSEWVRRQVFQGDWQALHELKQIGAPAVPFLVEHLDKQDSVFNTAWFKLWSSLPDRIKQKLPPAALARDIRMNAVAALRDMGPAAVGAVPALIERLADADGTISLHSVIALGNIGPQAQTATPAIQAFLSSPKHTVRVYTANALWKIERNPDEVLPVLEAGLQDTNAPFRWAAAAFLGEMGTAATSVIPKLTEAVNAPDKETASCAVQALAEISPATVPILVKLLADPDPALRMSATVALGKLGSQAAQAIPALRNLLADHETAEPAIMGRPSGRTKVSDEAAAALKRIEAQ